MTPALRETYPFLTVATYGDEQYIGIVQNANACFTSMYVLGALGDNDVVAILRAAEVWWWQSNRGIPINMFMNLAGWDFSRFDRCLLNFSTANLTIEAGPTVRLGDLPGNRTRRKRIKLTKRLACSSAR